MQVISREEVRKDPRRKKGREAADPDSIPVKAWRNLVLVWLTMLLNIPEGKRMLE